jgi:hypothetical protein
MRTILDNEAVAQLACRPNMRTFDDLVPEFRAAVLSGPDYDDGDPGTLSQLLHKGRSLSAADRPAALAAAKAFVTAHAPDGWSPEDVALRGVRMFTAAQRGSSDIIQSLRHSRSTRMSRFVMAARTTRTGREVLEMAEVHFFLRCVHQDAAVRTLRLAVCKLYSEQPQQHGMFVARESAVAKEHHAVDLDNLGAVLVTARVPGENKLYGIQYFNQSRIS